MKKLLTILAILAIIFIGLIYFVGGSALNKGIQTAVLKFGPGLTGTTVELADVDISVLGGGGALSGLVVGNPEGFSTENAFSLNKVELKLVPSSLMSDTIHIKLINIEAPEIALERANGTTNLQQIQKNIAEATSGSGEAPVEEEAPPAEEAGEPIKLIIDEFVLSDAKVTVAVMGQNQTLTLPTLRLTDLGSAKGGVPADEIAKEVMSAVVAAVSQAVTQIGMDALSSPEGMNDLKEKASGILGGFLKKKEPAEEAN